MTITWVLIANASHARIFLNRGCNKGLELIKDMEHPDSRKKGLELVSDEAGRQKQSAGAGARPGMEPDTQPKVLEAQRFARELADFLCEARKQNSFNRLLLVAPPNFLGLMREHLDTQTANLVIETMSKDYTRAGDNELMAHLGKVMCP